MLRQWFDHLCRRTAVVTGHPGTFASAIAIVVTWACLGPVFRYSDSWQLVVNTGTTIVTFLMVFLIQNSQNRDTLAIHAKLDELIRVNENARDTIAGVEDKTEQEIAALKTSQVTSGSFAGRE